MNELPSRYRRLFDYEKDSHQKVLMVLRAVPQLQRRSDAFQKAIDLLAHVIAARRVWLHRFGEVPAPSQGLFPTQTTLDDLASRLSEMESAWTAYLSRVTDADLARVFEYQSLDSGRFRNTIDEILTQLYGHSLYHRGQIALLLRQMGTEPPVTDFVYWSRQAIA